MKRFAPWLAVIVLIALGVAATVGTYFSSAMRLLVIA